MAEKTAQDIQVYDGSAWRSLRAQKVYDGSDWKDFHGVCDGTDWWCVLDKPPEVIMTMVTATPNVSLIIFKRGDIEVDWGDGTKEKNGSKHTYTDGLEHTIRFYGSSTTLSTLYCASNQLTVLDVSKCTTLTSLHCSMNRLVTLDMSGCTALTDLTCNTNKLAALNISNCTALTALTCNNNPFILESMPLKICAMSLPDRTGKEKGTLTIDNSNAQIGIQSVCDGKNWRVL